MLERGSKLLGIDKARIQVLRTKPVTRIAVLGSVFLPGGYKRSTPSSRFYEDRFTDGLGPPQRGMLILELSTKLRMIASVEEVGK